MSAPAKSKTSGQAEDLRRLQLNLIAYGSSADDPTDDSRFSGEDQRRVVVTATPLVPAELLPGVQGNTRAITPWAQKVARRLVLDIKHSQSWHCEFCGKCATSIAIGHTFIRAH